MSRRKFQLGDVVQIEDFDELYEIETLVTSVHHYNDGSSHEEELYILRDVETRDIVEAYEDELILVQTSESYAKSKTPDPIKSTKATKVEQKGKKKELDYDELLDKYNDYKMLYELWGDRRFKTIMTNTIKKMKDMKAKEV